MRISDWSSDVCSSDLKWRGGFSRLIGFDDADGLKNRMRRLFTGESQGTYKQSIWNFRRAFCKSNFAPGAFPSDITMLMNGNSYSHGNLIGGTEEEAKLHFEQARHKSLSLFYFLQTEIDRKSTRLNYSH